MKALPVAPAAEKNKDVILDELRNEISSGDRVLEIGSGTGQHVCHFAAAMPDVHWLPSELPDSLDHISNYRTASGLPNIAEPIALNVLDHPWPDLSVSVCLTANTFHIISMQAVEALFEGCAGVLGERGKLIVYGPFANNGQHTSASNDSFDQFLRQQDPLSGVRDLVELDVIANSSGFKSHRAIEMPVNNLLVIWERA